MILDKITLVPLYQTIYRLLLNEGLSGGPELMKAIDNEIEGRGYYVEGESHDTLLIKADPDVVIAPTPSDLDKCLQENASLREEVALLRNRNNDLASVIAGYDNWKRELKKIVNGNGRLWKNV